MCEISHTNNGIQAKKGRLKIELTVHRFGSDMVALLSGGATHIGAISLGEPGRACATLERRGHREGQLAAQIAHILADRLGGNIAVICGIHYNAIMDAEIGDILDLAPRLAMRIAPAPGGIPALRQHLRRGPVKRPSRIRARSGSRRKSALPCAASFNPETTHAEDGTAGTDPELS